MEAESPTERPTPLWGRERAVVGGLVLLAIALRVVYVLGARSSPFFDAPTMDMAYHVDWARAWAAGEDFQPGPFFRAPLYVWFLGVTQWIGGEGLLFPRLVQCLFGGATTALVYLVGKRAFDAPTGALAALGAATYWVLIYFDAELLIPTLAVPLDLAALYVTLGQGERPTRRGAAAAGLLWGLSAIARPNVLLFVPFVAVWLVTRARRGGRAGLAPALALAAGVAAPILPITAYNTFVGGDAVLISTQAGVNFWIGNNPDSDGSTAIVPGTRGGWWEGYHDSIAMAEAAEGRELAPSEVSRHYAAKAWSWIRAEPGAAASHLLWKLRLFGTDWELGNNQDVRFFARHTNPFVRFLPLRFGVLLGLGLVGAALASKRAASTFPLWGFLLVYTASVVAFFVCSRFRVPVLPVLLVFAAHAVVWSARELRAGRRAGASTALLVALAIAILSGIRPPGLRSSDANGLLQLGIGHALGGDQRAAIEYLERALDEDPGNAYVRWELGKALVANDDAPAAERLMEETLELHPDVPEALALLLQVLNDDDRPAEVERRATDALARNARMPEVRFQLGRALAAMNRFAPAIEQFETVAQSDPRHFAAAYGAAVLHEERNDRDRAIQWYQRAAERLAAAEEPFAIQTLSALVRLLESAGRSAEARPYSEELERRRR